MFKNAIAYAVTPGFLLDPELLKRQTATECGPSQAHAAGFIAPCGHSTTELVHQVAGYSLICFQTEDKILPSSVVDEAVAERAAEIEDREGRKLGRKERRELKERVFEELLPRAFVQKRRTLALFGGDYLIINTSSQPRAELVIEGLRKALEALPLSRLRTTHGAAGMMGVWISSNVMPDGLTVDLDCMLESAEGSKVKYSLTDLGADDVRERIANGFTPTKLAMTFADRISFVLTDSLHLTRLSLLDIVTEDARLNAQDAADIFDIDVTLMAGELIRLLDFLIDTLGGAPVPEDDILKAA